MDDDINVLFKKSPLFGHIVHLNNASELDVKKLNDYFRILFSNKIDSRIYEVYATNLLYKLNLRHDLALIFKTEIQKIMLDNENILQSYINHSTWYKYSGDPNFNPYLRTYDQKGIEEYNLRNIGKNLLHEFAKELLK